MPGGSTSTQTFTQNAQPWGPQAERLREGFTRAEDLYQAGPRQFFPGQTYVGFSPQTEQALQLAENRALSGSPVINQASGQLQNTLGGDYLRSNPAFDYLESTARGDFLSQGNPYLDQIWNRAAGDITDRINAQFGAAGRTGSPAQTENLARGLGDAAAQLYGQDFAQQQANQMSAASMLSRAYGDERGRQLQSMLFAPTIAQQDYADIGQLANVGATREGAEQAALEDAIQRHNFGQQAEADRLGQYFGFIGGNYGGTTTATQPVYSNRGASALGGAVLGAGIANNLGLGGASGMSMGGLGMAGLGGILGLL